MTALILLPPLPSESWSPFHFDPGSLLWTWIVFGVVVFILAKTAWKPLLKSLEERERKMEDGLKRAERAETEAKRAAAETQAKLQEAYAKADKIVEETRARGEKLGRELEAEARANAEKLVQQARSEITLAKSQAVEELRVQAVDLALEVAGNVLHRNLNQEDNQRLAREAIDLMKKGGAPVTERTIARRYVRALFELALEQHVADGVLEDLTRVNQRLSTDVPLAAALFDPRADAKKKRAAAAKATDGPGGALVKDFAAFLVDHGRIEVLPLAAGEFAAMLREHRNEAIAEVVSAAPLDAEAKKALVAALEGITQKKIALQEQVDPALLGGMRVKVGSMLLDGSVQRRLAGMREDLLRVALPR